MNECPVSCLVVVVGRYIILAVEQMRANEKDDKKMAISCFDTIELDKDKWRVGHTKACISLPKTILKTVSFNPCKPQSHLYGPL